MNSKTCYEITSLHLKRSNKKKTNNRNVVKQKIRLLTQQIQSTLN